MTAKITRVEKYRYRVETTSGEKLGEVRATDEGDAYRAAKVKYGSLGIVVRMI